MNHAIIQNNKLNNNMQIVPNSIKPTGIIIQKRSKRVVDEEEQWVTNFTSQSSISTPSKFAREGATAGLGRQEFRHDLNILA